MAGNDAAFIVDKHRNRPAPFVDGRRDLVDLLWAMRAGIAGIGDQRGNRAPFNFICWPFWLQNMFSWGLRLCRAQRSGHGSRQEWLEYCLFILPWFPPRHVTLALALAA